MIFNRITDNLIVNEYLSITLSLREFFLTVKEAPEPVEYQLVA